MTRDEEIRRIILHLYRLVLINKMDIGTALRIDKVSTSHLRQVRLKFLEPFFIGNYE